MQSACPPYGSSAGGQAQRWRLGPPVDGARRIVVCAVPDTRGPSWWDDPIVSGLLIVDDDVGFRSLVRALMAAEEFSVAGEAGDGASALEAVERLRPDMVLLDVQLPDLDGFDVARCIMASAGTHRPVVVLVSSRNASSYRSRLKSSPALGFITNGELTGASLSALIV